MKQFLTLAFLLFTGCFVYSQKAERHIMFKSIDKDSLSLTFNDENFLIEDSCAQIIRHARVNLQTRKFYGRFTDVSKADPNLIVSEGTYTVDGLKDGLFISHYLNGKLRGKGSFKNDVYDGKWEMYYDDGKPSLKFEVINGVFNITDVWMPDGTKTVDNGNGIYAAHSLVFYWKGKLVNGQPDGKWNLYNADDISETPVSTEHFKKGQFKDGSTGDFNYTNKSHMVLVDPNRLFYVNAEKFLLSEVPCGSAKRKLIVDAQYEGGLQLFSTYIDNAVSRYIAYIDLTKIVGAIDIVGAVSETGGITDLKNDRSMNEDIARDIIVRLKNLPPLRPATIDGKPVKQRFKISFTFSDGSYRFSYQLLPIIAD